jgi:hypothetical protein
LITIGPVFTTIVGGGCTGFFRRNGNVQAVFAQASATVNRRARKLEEERGNGGAIREASVLRDGRETR